MDKCLINLVRVLYNKDMKILGIILIAAFVVGLSYLVYLKDSPGGILGGATEPNRCEFFSQLASRGIKGPVKVAPGKVFKFSVTSSNSLPTYFQLYDQTNKIVRGGGYATPSFSIPLPLITAGATPLMLTYDLPAPMSFTSSGITYAISKNFANFASGSSYKNFVVNICYE